MDANGKSMKPSLGGHGMPEVLKLGFSFFL